MQMRKKKLRIRCCYSDSHSKSELFVKMRDTRSCRFEFGSLTLFQFTISLNAMHGKSFQINVVSTSFYAPFKLPDGNGIYCEIRNNMKCISCFIIVFFILRS